MEKNDFVDAMTANLSSESFGAPSSGHYDVFPVISPGGYGLLAIIVVVVNVEFKILWTLEQTICVACHFISFSFGSIEV